MPLQQQLDFPASNISSMSEGEPSMLALLLAKRRPPLVATALVLLYLVYRCAGLNKHPVVVLVKHAATSLTAMALAPLANLLKSSASAPIQPTSPPAITAEWMTWLLREKKLLTASQEVVSVHVTEFEAGKTGKCGRVKLCYGGSDEASPPSAAAPASVVVKMSRQDFKGRFLNLVMSLSREAIFFAECGEECPMRIPKCLYRCISHPARFALAGPTPHASLSCYVSRSNSERGHCYIVH